MDQTKEKLALEYMRGCNCCQAVLLAFKDETGLSESELKALGSTFGGGMGGMEGTCGALVGAEMVLGITGFKGTPMSGKAKQLYSAFSDMIGSGICKEIKGITTGRPLASCEACVAYAASLLQKILNSNTSKTVVRNEEQPPVSIQSADGEQIKIDLQSADGSNPGFGKQAVDRVTAYVDGSYNVATCEYSYGVVAFVGDEKKTFSEKFNDPELATMRNVAGELEGAMKAMRYAAQLGASELDIYYDYEGIEKWCTGAWKTNKDGTKAYKAFYESLAGKLKVNFHKVKGHSGDRYNDEADKLAKDQLGIS